MSGLFGQNTDALSNMYIYFAGEDYFVGDLAKESRSASRIFEWERFSHTYTNILLNSAIQAVADESWRGFSWQRVFRLITTGIQPDIEWKTGPLANRERKMSIDQALIFPQGASAVFSALINHEGSFAYPHLMNEGGGDWAD
ncbi:hypothetical protein [Domibacillus robiginosus]|uniref:hypothetical protein n=1 Tax=Domibacillus robiginosus TaxID=1071054 RepID=UPI00067CDCBE|nr:hypothetical protein [Domibacillus robiginosus]